MQFVIFISACLGLAKGLFEMKVSKPLHREQKERPNDPWMGDWDNGYRSTRKSVFDFFGGK